MWYGDIYGIYFAAEWTGIILFQFAELKQKSTESTSCMLI